MDLITLYKKSRDLETAIECASKISWLAGPAGAESRDYLIRYLTSEKVSLEDEITEAEYDEFFHANWRMKK